MTFFTILGLTLSIVNFEYDQIQYNKLNKVDLKNEITEVAAMDTKRFTRETTNFFRIIVLITSLCSVFFLFLR